MKINKERGTAHFQHFTSTNLQVAPEGSIKVGLSNGAFFTFDNNNNFELNIGTLDISGTMDGSLNVDSNNEVNVNTGKMTVNGNFYVNGEANFSVGASGAFLTLGHLVIVKNGLIVAIKP